MIGSLPPTCSHCGLPVRRPIRAGEEAFCCYGCYLVRRIVGPQDGQGLRAWHILRLGVGTFLSMDVMMISLLLYGGSIEAPAQEAFRWIMLVLAGPATVLMIYPFVLGSAGELRRRRLSLDTLIAVGAAAAFGLSAANVIRGRGEVYFDTATMLLVLMTVGRFIEASAKTRAADLTSALRTLLPREATRLETQGPRAVALSDLAVGDRVLVRPGERFPVDGLIVEGDTLVEQAQFTGEPGRQPRSAGQDVIAGTINARNPVVVRALRVGGGLLLERIVQAVRQARQDQAPLERLANRLASAFIPVVLALAAGTAAYWAMAAGPARALMAALAVLVVACPCAMGIAAPLANLLAIAHAAAQGVVVRGADVMENVGKVRTVFFDKTGTLTLGRLGVADVRPADSRVSPDELLSRLAALESRSEHALAAAVTEEVKRRGLSIPEARDVRNFPGLGLRGVVGPEGLEVHAGSEDFVRGNGTEKGGDGVSPASECGEGVSPSCVAGILPASGCIKGILPLSSPFLAVSSSSSPQKQQQQSQQQDAGGTPATHEGKMPMLHDGATVVWLAWRGRVQGQVVFTDSPRDGATEAIARLREMGVETVMLSGDSAQAAGSLGEKLGIGRVYAPCLPDEKLRRISDAASEGLVAMAGDGVNDAPALAAAPVGIAMGAGTDLAQQAGNVVLVKSRLEQIPELIALGRRARRIVVQNLLWALGYNAVALALAAAGLLHPLLAAVAMTVSSVTVLGNSFRVRNLDSEK